MCVIFLVDFFFLERGERMCEEENEREEQRKREI